MKFIDLLGGDYQFVGPRVLYFSNSTCSNRPVSHISQGECTVEIPEALYYDALISGC